MSESDQRPKVTIEDLLRLKRAERPGAEFWSNFERELRQKQLSALLDKRPWWQEMPQFFARRAYLPLGATAILAFTLVSVRYSSPSPVAQLDPIPADSAPVVTHGKEIALTAAVSTPVSSPLINRNASTVSRDNIPSVAAAVEPSAEAGADNRATTASAPVASERPSARSIAANLAHLEQADPDLMNVVLNGRLSTPVRVHPVSAPDIELASLSAGAVKRSRILANYNERQLNPEPTAPDIVRERLSRRLGDTDYADRFSRIGLKGDQVSLGVTIKL